MTIMFTNIVLTAGQLILLLLSSDICICHAGSIIRNSDFEEGVFYRRFHHIRVNVGDAVINTIQVNNLYECARECVLDNRCKAFHLDMGPLQNEKRNCELVKYDASNLGWIHFSPATNYSYFDTEPEHFRSCVMIYKYNGFFKSSTYTTRPSDSDSSTLHVTCELDGNRIKTGLAVTGSTTRWVNGYGSPGSFSWTISYQGSFSQAQMLSQMADSCRQLVKAWCTGSNINWNAGTPNLYATNKNGQRIAYWGGGDSSHYCYCGRTNQCSGECYCSGVENAEYIDGGFYTEKDLLPIKSIHAGDTINYDTFWKKYNKDFELSIGSMECYTDL